VAQIFGRARQASSTTTTNTQKNSPGKITNKPMSSSFVNNLAHHGAPASIVVVAKCPKAGSSKTRLIPALGEQGAADFAKAMMLDVLSTIAECVSVVVVVVVVVVVRKWIC
jgi:hypothetical protein